MFSWLSQDTLDIWKQKWMLWSLEGKEIPDVNEILKPIAAHEPRMLDQMHPPLSSFPGAPYIHGRYNDGSPWPSLQELMDKKRAAHPNWPEDGRPGPVTENLPLRKYAAQILQTSPPARSPKASSGETKLGLFALAKPQHPRDMLKVPATRDSRTLGLEIDGRLTSEDTHESSLWTAHQKIRVEPAMAAVVLLGHQLDLEAKRKVAAGQSLEDHTFITLPDRDHPDAPIPDLEHEWSRTFPWTMHVDGNFRLDTEHPAFKKSLKQVLNMSPEEQAEIIPYVRRLRESLSWEPRIKLQPVWLLPPPSYGGESRISPLLEMDPQKLRRMVRPKDFDKPRLPEGVDPQLWREVRRELAWTPKWAGRPFLSLVYPAIMIDPELGVLERKPEALDLLDPTGEQRLDYRRPWDMFCGTFISSLSHWERIYRKNWRHSTPPPNYPSPALVPDRAYPRDPTRMPLPGEAGIPPLPLFDPSIYDNFWDYDWSVPPPVDDRWFMPFPIKVALWGAAGAAVFMLGRKFLPKLLPKKTVNRNWYEGGFESPMSKREAILVLNLRGSATKERIMERYRAMMRLNHPDLGGSPFVSTKINEAKELLLKAGGYK